MTSGKYRNVTLSILIVFCLFYVAFVTVFEHYSRLKARESIKQHARVISDALWKWDSGGASEYLKLAAVSNYYERLSVTDTSGEVFLTVSRPVDNWLDKIFMEMRIIPRVDLMAYVEHEGTPIGVIEASWRPRTIFLYVYTLVFMALIGAIVYLYIRIIQSKTALEDRVRARTAELVESNASLQQEIADRKKANEERNRLQEQLQQARKMEAIGTLAGGVAHDFNNLLQAIGGYSEILLYEREEDNPDFKKLEAIKKACERAAQLVQQLLLFSRKAETEKKPLDLNHVIDQTHKILERTIPKMIDIELCLDDSLLKINADPVQLEQILLNLATNASDAMPDGGSLSITSENRVLEDNNPLGAKAGPYVLLTVADTGCGMADDVVEHIFEPFFTTKEIGKGTGLGLASVYGIVEEHGGHITCNSESGRGTTFRIYFPGIANADCVEGISDIDTPKEGAETILIIDDEESIRALASEAMERFGYTVTTASSGEEAVEIYSEKHNIIDLVILDIGMPGMGGYKCLQEIIRIEPHAKVIIASGYSGDGAIKKFLETGASAYVGKPYRMTSMLSKVRAVLNEREKSS